MQLFPLTVIGPTVSVNATHQAQPGRRLREASMGGKGEGGGGCLVMLRGLRSRGRRWLLGGCWTRARSDTAEFCCSRRTLRMNLAYRSIQDVLTGAEAALPYVFMSTYYVTNADKDKNDVVTDLKASKDSQTAAGTVMTKKALIDLIETDGHSAKTYNAGKSEDIRVVDKKFLRTDSNNTKADNLGSLPKISR